MINSSAKRRVQIVFLCILGSFLAGTVLVSVCKPLVRLIVGEGLDEHRASNPFPDMHLLFNSDASVFSQALNQWADDHVGLRDPFIQLKTQLDYSLFNTSRKVYIGSNHFLFDRATDQLLDIERANKQQIDQAEQGYTHLAQIVAAHGMTLIIVVNTNKALLYPEYLPADAPHIPPKGKWAELDDFFTHMPGVIFIDAEKLLSPLKNPEDQPLYYRLDIHHRPAAVIPIVKKIISHIAQLEGRPEMTWSESFHTNYNSKDMTNGGSETRALGLLRRLKEEDMEPYDLYTIGKPEPDGHWNADMVNGKLNDQADFDFISNPELCSHRLPPTLIYGNSFTDLYWAVGFHRYFCSVWRTKSNANPPQDMATHMQNFIDHRPPGTKYFIYQILTSQALNAPPLTLH